MSRPRQQHCELVAAEPEDDIGGAQAALDPPGGAAKNLVADAVTDRVVDGLEVVEIEQKQAHRGSRPDVALQLALEGAPVGHPGQAIDARHVLDLDLAARQIDPGSVEVKAHHHKSDGQDRGSRDHQAGRNRTSG